MGGFGFNEEWKAKMGVTAAYAIERGRDGVHPPRLKTEQGLRRVLARVIGGLDDLSDGINGGVLSVAEWREQMADLLAVGHVAGWQEGRDRRDLGRLAREAINRELAAQTRYLSRFAAEVDARGWQDAQDRARARLYAGAIKATYWRGATFGLQMPFYPTVGSECMVNCRCAWEIVWESEEELDATCYWRMGAAEHCATCKDRANGNPYVFRGGVLQR